MTDSINLDMINRLEIADHIYQSYPCEHNCRLILVDGRAADQNLSGIKICALIKFLAKEKIIFPGEVDHFSEFDNAEWLKWYQGTGVLPSPEKILSSFIF